MTLDKFTIKAQEAVQEAVNTAQRGGQQTIEPIHLLAGIMNKAKDGSWVLMLSRLTCWYSQSCSICPK